MPTTQHHIIRRQFLHVEMHGTESDGLALQHRLPDLCQSWLMPALERMLERVVPPHEHWIIDSLDIDVGMITLDNLERDLTEAVTQAIEKQLRERAPPTAVSDASFISPMQRKTEPQSVHEAFIHFLKTGSLPWWFHLPAGETLEQAVQASWQATAVGPVYFARSMLDAIGSASVQKRLAQQFSADFLEALLASISQEGAKVMHEVFAKLGNRDFASGALRRFSIQLWQIAFATAAVGRHPTASTLVAECWSALHDAERHEPALLERMTQHWPEALEVANLNEHANADAGLRQRSSKERTLPNGNARHEAGMAKQANRAERDEILEHVDLKEGVYIGCAGLVLLHPFLPRLFEGVGIAAEDKLMQPERALCLLHFLATGQRVAPEYELLLPKLLCNVPLEAPVESLIELTADEEAEAAALLQAVIQHWDALGDTSADGLRGTFLVRPGKLSRRDDGDYLLQVEPRSFDILMDQLPWGIGAIKLPWMEKMLWVEWRQ